MSSTEIYNCENEDHNDSYGECLNCWGGKANRERDEWEAMADRLAEDLRETLKAHTWFFDGPYGSSPEPEAGPKARNTIDACLKLKEGK